jgi:uncharacterized protein (DUF849 family)
VIFENDQTIIDFTPTGMVPTKKMTPHAPLSVNEIIEDVHRVYEIGITIVHLHARDEVTGKPTYKAVVYAKIIEGIRKFAPDLIVCVSLSGRQVCEFAKRAEPLFLEGNAKPDMGSLTLSSINFNKAASINEPEMIKKLAKTMIERNIKPELEVFDVGMINYAKYMRERQLLTPPYYFNLILGNIASAQADLLHTGIMIKDLPEDSIWSMGGIGDAQFMMNSIAIAIGGGVRVGLEDNIWYDKSKSRLATNFELTKRIHSLIEFHGKKMLSAKDLRRKLFLNS